MSSARTYLNRAPDLGGRNFFVTAMGAKLKTIEISPAHAAFAP